jgi:parallel beta-helix repeat protein
MSYQTRYFAITSKTYLFGLLLALTFPLPFNNLVLAQSLNAQSPITSETNIIYINPETGNDSHGGTESSPLKTITKALQIAGDNTIISLARGTYSEATGERFPLIIKSSVSLQGTSGGQGHNVIIRGGGYFISPTAAGQNVAIAASKSAKEIKGITVINPEHRGHGLWIESASPTVSHSSFINNGNTGLSVNGKSSPIITNNYFHNNNGNGLLVYGTSKPQVKDNTFESTGFAVSIVQNAAPILVGNKFSNNRIGVILEGKSQATLRNNQIENSQEYGLVAIANSQADLGNTEEPGNNTFRNNRKLDIQNATSNAILAVGTEINGHTEGNIDFRGDSTPIIANNQLDRDEPKSLTLNVTARQQSSSSDTNSLPSNLSSLSSNETLPAPKPIPVPSSLPESSTTTSSPLISPPTSANNSVENSNKDTKELVFTAPSSDSQASDNSNSVMNPPTTLSHNSITENNLPSQPSPITTLPRNRITTLSDVFSSQSSSTINQTQYRVLVETNNNSQQSQVRSLYPDAFTTVYQGKSMLQVGAFSNKSKAENAVRSLIDLGLNSFILE